ncbi:MAG: iron ABC transporter permease, partial [Treponema sp.]|nr:iron ABC transporter permease [Treponema sp.]
YNFPIVMSSTADCWAELNTDQADSARLLGAGEVRCFMDITLFQLLPAIISGAITVFIYCFFSFMFVLLFGVTAGTTLEVAIYHAGKSRLDFRTAAILSIIESISAMTALFALAKAEDAAKRQKGLSLHSDKNDPIALAKKEIAPAAALILIIAIFFVLPLLSIVFSSFTTRTGGQKAFSFKAWSQLFQMKSFHISLRNTLFTATATGITCSMAALVPALILRLSKFIGKSLIRTLALFPMAVSSVIMGLGMTILIRRGSPVMLVLAQSALYWPFAFRQIQTCLSKIPDSVIEAATILSPCKTDGLLKVILPYCRRSIISGTLLCFAMSCSDATLPLVLSIYKFDTLSLFTYRLAGSYRFTQASAAGSVLGLVCILAFSLSNMAKEKHGIL